MYPDAIILRYKNKLDNRGPWGGRRRAPRVGRTRRLLTHEALESRRLLADSLTLSVPASVMSEAAAGALVATVTRSGATTGSLVVSLSSSDLTELWVPATVTIPAGSASATFGV